MERFDKVVYTREVTFGDIYDDMDEEDQERVDYMSDEEFDQFIERNKSSWKGGIDGGAFSDFQGIVQALEFKF